MTDQPRFSIAHEDPCHGPPGAVVCDRTHEMGAISCSESDARDVCEALNMWDANRARLFKIFDGVADRVLGDKYK